MNGRPTSTPTTSTTEGLSLGELMAILWGGRRIIMGATLMALILAGLYVYFATPIYRMEALLQVEAKQNIPGRPALEGKVEGLFQVSSQAQAEVEILQSNKVLGRVVQALHLDLSSAPKKNPLLGLTSYGGVKNPPHIDVESFKAPDEALDKEFTLEFSGDGAFELKDPDKHALAQGKVGQIVHASWLGQPMELKVRSLTGKPGQSFSLQLRHMQSAIELLRRNLTVAEKGKETNILSLTYEHPQPVRGAEILNAILEQYNGENIERKTGEASRILTFLQQQMSQARDQLAKSEQLLAQFRAGSRSTDLGEEARLVLQRTVDLEKENLALRQKREDLLRIYQERSDVVSTLDQQIAKIQEEGQRLNSLGRSLPRTQQEVLRLTRDVQVNQEHYNSLRNLEAINTQQLQMAKAGDIRNARIVDWAMPTLIPVKPNKVLVIGLGALMGALIGTGLLMLHRGLHPAVVEDPQLLETQFNLPVLATIPHSTKQAELTRQSRRVGEQVALLSTHHPQDMAIESLRSLRTNLHFALMDTPRRAILFAGASPEIGKSFVCANFAVILAQYGARVLLVDADLRKGKLHRHFGIMTRKKGLSEILAGNLTWRETLHHGHGLDMISTGTLPPNPSKLLFGDRFGSFITEVCAAYDYVIVDAPPVLAVTDAAIIGAHMGAVLLLVKDGQHPLGEIRQALQCLDIAGIRTKGFVFNDLNLQNALLGYRRYVYHYTYQSQSS